MAKKKQYIQVFTAPGTLSFPVLHEPKKFRDPATGKEQGEPKYSTDLIFDSKDDVKKSIGGKPSLYNAIIQAATDEWGPDKKKWPFTLGSVLRDGDKNKSKEGEVRKGYEGKVYITARTTSKPDLLDKMTGNKAPTKEDMYGGCRAQLALAVGTYRISERNQGIVIYLNAVAKIGAGTRFGGRDSSSFFAATEQAEEASAWGEENSGSDDNWSGEQSDAASDAAAASDW